MKVTFKHPQVKDAHGNESLNPFQDFKANEINHYPDEKGIYINGLKLKVKGETKFIPLYVGITETRTLRIRLYNEHYLKYRAYGKGKKELWDFSKTTYLLKDIHSRYSEMYHYDYINSIVNPVRKNRKAQKYISELLYLNHLIFFQNENYFLLKNGKNFGTHTNVNHLEAVNKYPILSKDIIDTKKNYDKNFYFVYANMNDVIKNNDLDTTNSIQLAKNIELATKKALNVIGIHTTATTGIDAELIDMDIDLTELQENLINLGGHPFNINGQYNNLIIKVRS